MCLGMWVLGDRPACAWTSPAPDIVLYSAPSLDRVMHALAARFTARRHVPVHIFVAPPAGLIGLLTHRARADLVVADAATLNTMAATGLVRPDSIVALGADPFVLIARTGTTPPNALRHLVLTDPTTAAEFSGAAVLAHATPPLPTEGAAGVADTPTVIAVTSADPHLLGLVHRTEADAPGIALAATLTAPATPMAGALVSLGQSGHAADLLGFIAGPDGRAALRAAGLETPP